MVIAVRDEAGVDLRHPAEQLLLVVVQRVPGADGVLLGPRLAVRPLRVDVGVDRRELRPLGDEPHLDLTGKHLLAVLLVAHVELALVPVGPLLGHVMRGVAGPGSEVQEPRLVGIRRLAVTDVLERLVGDVLREVIAVLRQVRLIDGLVVLDEQRVPLVGLTAEEAVEALEATAEWPLGPRTGGVVVEVRRQVPLAEGVRAVAVVDEHLREHRVLERDPRVRAGVAGGELRDARHAVRGGIAPGQQTRACRRAQRRGVELRVAKAPLGKARQVGRLDETAEAIEGAEADVVPEDEEEVGRPFRGPRRLVRSPVRLGVSNVDRDASTEAASSPWLILSRSVDWTQRADARRGRRHRAR